MIYLAISSVLIIGIYQAFHTQQKSYINQSNTAEMQQNIRSGIYAMMREIRSAGYDPTRNAGAGFVPKFDPPNDKFVINYADAKEIIAFTIDNNGDGAISADSTEQIAYQFNPPTRTLERFNAEKTVWEVVADNVDALNFVYRQADGTPATDPEDIRYVEIALLVRSRSPDSKFVDTTTYHNKEGDVLCASCTGDHYRRRLLTTTVQARNVR
jgi:type IV pilus assembly protein PilW